MEGLVCDLSQVKNKAKGHDCSLVTQFSAPWEPAVSQSQGAEAYRAAGQNSCFADSTPFSVNLSTVSGNLCTCLLHRSFRSCLCLVKSAWRGTTRAQQRDSPDALLGCLQP